MATSPSPVSLEEYMHTSYSPDCEYIDGLILERHVGQTKHAFTQTEIVSHLRALVKAKLLFALVEQRVRVAPARVRVPDVCVIGALDKEVIAIPPLLCVEVLSPDDRWSRVNASISDYQNMEVPSVWVVDPYRRAAWIFDQEQPPVQIASEGFLRAESLGIEIQLSQVLPPEV